MSDIVCTDCGKAISGVYTVVGTPAVSPPTVGECCLWKYVATDELAERDETIRSLRSRVEELEKARPSVDQICDDAQRTIEVHDGVLRLKADNARLRDELRNLHHVAHQFKYPPDAKLLRYIADEIDCGPCENMSFEHDTGHSSCRKEDDGKCPAANAWALREFAKAVELYQTPPLQDVEGESKT